MANRSEDWFRQAESDLRLARTAAIGKSFEWACFAAQQAAEKAVKALALGRGAEAWGHSVTMLLSTVASDAPPDVVERSKRLDRHYIPSRYPNGLPGGAPVDFYTEAQAEEAIRDADIVVGWCRSHLG